MAKIGILIDSVSTYDEDFIKAHGIEKIALNLTNSRAENIPDDGTVDPKAVFEEIKSTKVL
jgi:fatty acid-binding protein DegV